jgi:hypothetical protein
MSLVDHNDDVFDLPIVTRLDWSSIRRQLGVAVALAAAIALSASALSFALSHDVHRASRAAQPSANQLPADDYSLGVMVNIP